MSIKILLRIAVLAIFLSAAGCTLVIISAEPAQVEATPTPEPVVLQTPTASVPTPAPTVVVECTSPLTPGTWTGTVDLKSTVTGSGLRVVNQTASLPLDLEIACDGSVTGTASRQGQASIRYPFILNGACSDQETYDVRGQVVEGQAEPGLQLQFTTRRGALACDINSSLSSIPEGEQRTDLTGRSFELLVYASQVSQNRIAGTQWADRLYEEQFTQLEEMITQFGLNSEKTSAWQLDRRQ